MTFPKLRFHLARELWFSDGDGIKETSLISLSTCKGVEVRGVQFICLWLMVTLMWSRRLEREYIEEQVNEYFPNNLGFEWRYDTDWEGDRQLVGVITVKRGTVHESLAALQALEGRLGNKLDEAILTLDFVEAE